MYTYPGSRMLDLPPEGSVIVKVRKGITAIYVGPSAQHLSSA